MNKLIQSKAMGTVELNTGLQISGTFTSMIEQDGKPVYIQTQGPTALAYREKELVGHGVQTHAEGYGTVLGKLKGINLSIEDMSPKDLKAYSIYEGKHVDLEFEGDITVSGTIITGIRNIFGKIQLISFKNCTVTHGETVLFQPEWGTYDMAVGTAIISGFSGPADSNSFNMVNHVPSSKTIKAKRDEERIKLEALYAKVRQVREENKDFDLQEILSTLMNEHKADWLLTVEIAELAKNKNLSSLYNKAIERLEIVSKERPKVAHLIKDGISIIENS